MKYLFVVWFGFAAAFFGVACKNGSLKSVLPSPSESTTTTTSASETPTAATTTPSAPIQVAVAGTDSTKASTTPPSDDWKQSLRLALGERRELTTKYREMTVDTLAMVIRCQGNLRVSAVGANLDTPYNNPKGFVVVAESAAEKMLQNQSPGGGCDIAEVSYWARDEDQRSDIVVRYGVSAAAPSTLWRVSDQGTIERIDPDQISVRFFSDRLVRVASFFAEVADEPELAKNHILAAEALDPESVRVAGVKAELLSTAAPDEAIQHLTTFMGSYGEDAGLLGTLASLYLEKGTPEDKTKADVAIEKAIVLDGTNFKALTAKAERQRDLGDFAGGVATYLTLNAADPTNNTFRFNFATMYLEVGQIQEAIAQLDLFLREYPEDLDALYLRAAQRLRLGEYDNAQKDVDTVLRIAPDNPDARRLADEVKQKRAETTVTTQ